MRQVKGNPATVRLSIRITPEEKEQLRALSESAGFDTVSNYVRYLLRLQQRQQFVGIVEESPDDKP